MPINQHKITLKDNWKGSGYLKQVAEFLNQVARLINGMHFIRGGDLEIDRNYIRLRVKTLSGFTPPFYTVRGDSDNPRTLKVFGGKVVAHGVGSWNVGAESSPSVPLGRISTGTAETVTVNGGTDLVPHYIVVKMNRSSKQVYILDTAIPYPDHSDNTNFWWPLSGWKRTGADTIKQVSLEHVGTNLYLDSALL